MRKFILVAVISGLASTANAGPRQITDDGSTAAVVVILAIAAVVALSGGFAASASQPRKDKAADEE